MFTIETIRTFNVSLELRREITNMCNEAYGQDFDLLFSLLPPDGLHLTGRLEGILVTHLVVTDRWLKPETGAQLRTAYIDAVATLPEFRRHGYAGQLITKAIGLFEGNHDLIALSANDPALYKKHGFHFWPGLQYLENETASGTEISPEQHNLMTRPALPGTGTSHIIANWRPGGGY